MDTVTIEINSRWVRIARSPLYWIVAALQGVAITFAPFILYLSGRGSFHHGSEWIIVPSCCIAILVVGFFYICLGNAVIRELKKKSVAVS